MRRNIEGPKQPKSLRVSDGFRTFVLDQLEPLGSVLPKSMFGGVGLYCDGVFFGLIALDVLYLKVDDTNRPDYEAAGAQPFRPFPERGGTMKYYAVPVEVLESQIELIEWARKAVRVAQRGARV
jgi:DNA transformation protein